MGKTDDSILMSLGCIYGLTFNELMHDYLERISNGVLEKDEIKESFGIIDVILSES